MQTQDRDGGKNGKTIVMTGGGTAGHVTPNIALIPHLREVGFTDIHYIGTNGIEKTLIEKLPDVTYHEIPSGKLRRYFSLQNFTDPFRVIAGIFKAIPHKACATETQIYFSSDCIEFLKAYCRMVRKLCVI